SPGTECIAVSPLSHNSSPANSQTGSLKRTKLQKKSAHSEGTVASDGSASVLVTSIASLGVAETVSLASLESDSSSGSRHGSLQRHSQTNSCPRKNFSSGNLTVYNHDASRSSSTSSPSHSPRLTRRAATSPGPLIPPSRPPAIDNSPLVEPCTAKVTILTGEGGRLKRNVPLVQGRDFVLVPESLWKALQTWYGGTPALPRQVIHGRSSGEVELELYPLTLRLFRHAQQQTRTPNNSWVGVVGGYGAAALKLGKDHAMGALSVACPLILGEIAHLPHLVESEKTIVSVLNTNDSAPYYVTSLPSTSSSSPKRYLAYLAAFSRLATLRQVYEYLAAKLRLRIEDMRLWCVRDE
ncbi:Ubiquitin carboxyl-terminal hydrolase 32, partial [Halocaridina rubra]